MGGYIELELLALLGWYTHYQEGIGDESLSRFEGAYVNEKYRYSKQIVYQLLLGIHENS